jgi:dolichyl-phosphate-mannose-protein mannosyltransferase
VPTAARNWLTPAAWVAAVAAFLLLVFPLGFPNYDTIYSLLWGRELAEGLSPDRGSTLPPTPHPLAELLGLMTSPLGDSAIDVTMVVAYVSLGLIGYLVYRLGSLWFDRPIGAVAALIVLTRAPYLSNGLRAYIDVPYIALVLGALLVETRRPRAGWPVLALLALAGLLRPEAWLFSIAYLAYLLFSYGQARKGKREGEEGVPLERTDTQKRGLIRPRFVRTRGTPSSPSSLAVRIRPAFVRARGALIASPAHWLPLIVLTFAGPILWALFDWITAGSPTYSFTGTRETVETLERQTGAVDLVLYGPRRLGEVLQWPGMVGAAGGIVLGLTFLRRRSTTGVASAVLALAAFALLACAGLAIIPRYTMLAAAILAVFAALGLLGWRLLEAGHPWRRAWQGFAALIALMFVAWGPNQYDLLSRVDTDLTNQAAIESDLDDLAESGAFEPLCPPISVPNHRAVPRLAFDLDLRPSGIVSFSEQRQPSHGYFLDPASPFVVHNFILDPNDLARLATPVPRGFRKVASNESWVLYRRCRGGG